MDWSERAYLDNIGHPIFALQVGEDGLPRYCAFNEVARGLVGRREEEILGLTAGELYPGRLGQIAMERHAEVLRTGREATYELTLPLKAGQRRMRTTLRPEKDEDGVVLRLFGSSIDVSDRQTLIEMRANAATLSGELDKFIGDAAIEFREPMLKVKAVADMLRNGFVDLGDGKLELIDALERLSTDAMMLIADALGQVATVVEEGDHSDFEITAIVNEIMSQLDPLSKCICRVAPAQIRADRTATLIVLRALIENAKKRYLALERGSLVGVPAISVSVSDADEGMVAITLKDNGAALDKSVLSMLNGATFHRGGDAALLEARRLLVARRGRIAAENIPGGGVKLSFAFPGEVQVPVRATSASLRSR